MLVWVSLSPECAEDRTRTNYPHVGENWENITPTQTAKRRPSLEQATRRISKKGGDEFEHERACNLHQGHRAQSQALKEEVGDVEVGSLGQILS